MKLLKRFQTNGGADIFKPICRVFVMLIMRKLERKEMQNAKRIAFI